MIRSKAFREALSRRPDYALAHGNLGRVLLVKGEVRGGARSTSRKPCGSIRNNPQSLLGLSEALAQRGDFDRAIEMLDRAMRLPLNDALRAEIRAKRELYRQAAEASKPQALTWLLARSGHRLDDLLDQRLRAARTSAGPAGMTTPCRRDRSSRRSASSTRRTSSTGRR